MESMPFVSILIPTRENEKDLLDCLESIDNLDYPLEKTEIIVWDNHSSYESKKNVKDTIDHLTRERQRRIEFIENFKNSGVYTSRNELIKRIQPQSQFVLSLDDDVILPPQFLRELIPVINQNPSIGIIGPRIVYDTYPTETAHGAGFINWWFGKYKDVDARKAIECDYVIGCCMIIRRTTIDEIGNFDLDYFTSHGEVDYCLRAKKNGYKILYWPSLTVRHRVEKGGTQTPERLYYIFRNKLLVIKRNAPLPQKWISLFIYFVFWIPKSVNESIAKHRGVNATELMVILRGIIDGWRNKTGKKIKRF
jgi:GT2 family glycosyltransferase